VEKHLIFCSLILLMFYYALIIGYMFSSSAERKKRAEETQQSAPANGKPAESNGGPVSHILCFCPPMCLEPLHACFDVLTSWANKLRLICSFMCFIFIKMKSVEDGCMIIFEAFNVPLMYVLILLLALMHHISHSNLFCVFHLCTSTTSFEFQYFI